MKKTLVRVYSYLRNIVRLHKWNQQVKALRNNTATKKLNKLEVDGHYLILLPHADDEWIGASSIIKNMNYDVSLCNMDMPGGDNKEIHCIRENELYQLGDNYRRTIIKYRGNLKEIIEIDDPKYILIPFFIDWHPEHIKVMEALFDYLQNENESKVTIVMYQVSVPINEEFLNRVNPLSKTDSNEKWSVFRKIYKSQAKIPYQRFRCNEQITGALVNAYAAEAYVEMTAKKWVRDYEKFIMNGSDYSVLKNDINDLQLVRVRVKEFT